MDDKSIGEIEAKLIRWLDSEGVFVNGREAAPVLYVLERMPGKARTPVATLRLRNLAHAIASGELAFTRRESAMHEALTWIASQQDLFFAECSQAEEIIARARSALAAGKPES